MADTFIPQQPRIARYAILAGLMITIFAYNIYVGDLWEVIKVLYHNAKDAANKEPIPKDNIARSLLVLLFGYIVGLMGNIHSERLEAMLATKADKKDLETKADKKDLETKADKKDLETKADKKDLDTNRALNDTNMVLEEKANKKDLSDVNHALNNTNIVLGEKADKKDISDVNHALANKADKNDHNMVWSDYLKSCDIYGGSYDESMNTGDFACIKDIEANYL
jgi:hypothetical protein